MKLLGIDYGTRRVGVAVTDPGGLIARGLTVIDRRNSPDLIQALKTIIAEQAPQKIVVGLPLDIDDNETIMAKEIREFAAALGPFVSAPIEFVDESLTSHRAHILLRGRKKKQRRRKAAADLIAACLILEAYLQEHACENSS